MLSKPKVSGQSQFIVYDGWRRGISTTALENKSDFISATMKYREGNKKL